MKTRQFILVGVYLALTTFVVAAPRGRPEPPPDSPAEDRVPGHFARRLGAPAVNVVDDGGKEYTVWLVFPSPAVEASVLKDFVVGAPVVAVGRVQCGGPYAYLIVYRLESP